MPELPVLVVRESRRDNALFVGLCLVVIVWLLASTLLRGVPPWVSLGFAAVLLPLAYLSMRDLRNPSPLLEADREGVSHIASGLRLAWREIADVHLISGSTRSLRITVTAPSLLDERYAASTRRGLSRPHGGSVDLVLGWPDPWGKELLERLDALRRSQGE